MRLLFFVIVLCVMPLLPGSAAYGRRTSGTVRSEQRDATEKIAATRRQLSQNEMETQQRMLDLQTLDAQIRQTEDTIAGLEQQMEHILRRRAVLSDSIADAERTLARLRRSYTASLRAARRQHRKVSAATFIFSSRSFAQARSRARWLKELNGWQSGKSEEIRRMTERLISTRSAYDSLGHRLHSSMDSIGSRRQMLAQQRHQADAIVGSLRRQRRNLDNVLRQQQLQQQQLEQELHRVIEEEARLAAEAEARARADADNRRRPRPDPKATMPDFNTAPSFALSKGRLPWPVNRRSAIVSTFGRHVHSAHEKVTTQNNGIDFDTSPGASARAVFAGTVSAVVVMPGYHNVVLLRHGEYITVYAGIAQLDVRKGQHVAAGQLLGTLFSDPNDNNRTRLHFELRHERDKLNPEEWLVHRQ